MGVSFSCPLAAYFDLDNGLECAIVKSIGCNDDQQKATLQSVKLGSQDSDPKILESVDSGEMLTDTESKNMGSQNSRPDITTVELPELLALDSGNPKHEAAVKLQKVYKSFRTRRKLADCAVLIEQSWWKLLDFAELKHSSISFFDLDKHETAISRWSRARTRAAKVGKGLSKNGKAQKLALQHWLEAIDPRHRYGHNLHFYYVRWLHSQSKEPFFYWLDIGEGKEINLFEKCPRSKLQQQCIKYLGPMERKAYEVAAEDGKLFYKQTGELLDTTSEPKAKWIFVLSTTRTLYIGKKKKGTFQHSSFLAGGATLAAGRIVAENGTLKAVWPHSGHYRPTPENFQDFISFLKENNVDLNDVKLDSSDEEEESVRRADSAYRRSNSSEDDLGQKDGLDSEENDIDDSSLDKNNSMKEVITTAVELPESRPVHRFGHELSYLQIPSKDDFIEKLKTENQAVELDPESLPPDSPMDGYETSEELFASERVAENQRPNSSSEDLFGLKEETVSEESILERISSVKGTNSYQLGKQLSCKWSTGAGPRIGCLRDYPSELQSHALEQANLSPRSSSSPRISFSSCVSTPSGLNREARMSPFWSSPEKGSLQHRMKHQCRTQPSPLWKGTSVTSAAKQS